MMTRLFTLLALLLTAPAFAQGEAVPPTPAPTGTLVVLHTAKGDITLSLDTEHAPITAGNFLRYVDEKRFDGTVFYRAMRLDWGDQPNGLVQGGTQMSPQRILPPIAHEPTDRTGLKHVAGAISMARYDPGTATGDFSIMISDQPSLDANPSSPDASQRAGFAVFGHGYIAQHFRRPDRPGQGRRLYEGAVSCRPCSDPVGAAV